MDHLELNILIASLIETQESLNEQMAKGNYDTVDHMWKLQRERGERLKNGNYFTRTHHSGTPEANSGDGQGQ
jgi:hypothetical protein